MRRVFDIVMGSDLRLPGGTAASMVEEIHAQARLGYQTAIFHIDSNLAHPGLGLESKLLRCIDEGKVTLILPGEAVQAKMLLLRNATVFAGDLSSVPDIEAEQLTLVANHVPVDHSGQVHYDVPAVNTALRDRFGLEATWRPIGPVVRRSLAPWSEEVRIAEADWNNLIDLEHWSSGERRTKMSDVPVIGRHSRPSPSKWPDTAKEIRRVYPTDGSVTVKVLGGAGPARQLLGGLPPSWHVEEFGARSPIAFLKELDFFVYFHSSSLVEAYGRTIIEAMASGVVVILPEHFSRTFGAAAVYARSERVQAVVSALWEDRRGYVEQQRRGFDFVRSHHGYLAHAERLENLIGKPLPSSAVREEVCSSRASVKKRVMFISSNGAGMGHLTRLLAMATRSSQSIEPIFFSMSQAVPVVSKYGFPWEYCPSRGDLQTTTKAWNPFFERRFADVLRRYAPQAIVFDGTMPYSGIINLRSKFPDISFIWSRRGMWREDTSSQYLDRSQFFDLIVEPGEVAHQFDVGPTSIREDAVRVAPITLVPASDVLDRVRAREELGLDADSPAVLISLGAGNINDIASDLETFAQAAFKLEGNWQVVVTKPPIARSGFDVSSKLKVITVYPLAKYLRAFDAAVIAAGYNTYHEVVSAGVPAVFVPNLATQTDDQAARSRFAEIQGFGAETIEATADTAFAALQTITSDAVREACLALAQRLSERDGAQEAMDQIEELLRIKGEIA